MKMLVFVVYYTHVIALISTKVTSDERDFCDMILLTANGLTPGGSSRVHIYTQTLVFVVYYTHVIALISTKVTSDERGFCDMIYLINAIGLTHGGSSTVHIYTQTMHITTHLTSWEECGPCPVFASYTLAFVLQLRKKHGKPSVKEAEECRLAR
jgi:hypothetical protein